MKEQCRNCTFLNGQFAEECEMCGEPLSHGRKAVIGAGEARTAGGGGGGGFREKEMSRGGSAAYNQSTPSRRQYRYSDSDSERYYR